MSNCSSSCAQVLIKCPVTYITVPVVDTRWQPGPPKLSRKRTWGQRKKGVQKKKKKGIPKRRGAMNPVRVVYTKWPIINPATLFKQLVAANAFELIHSKDWSWSSFWQQAAATEDWAKDHPVLSLEKSLQDKAIGCCFHGDEGQTKRQRNVLVLSWSSIGIHGKSEHTKLPFCVA